MEDELIESEEYINKPKCPYCWKHINFIEPKCLCPNCNARLKYIPEKNEYKMKLCNVFKMEGRLDRKEFIIRILIIYAFCLLIEMVSEAIPDFIHSYEAGAVFIISTLCITSVIGLRIFILYAMRIQDAGYSPYYLFIPIFGPFILPLFYKSKYTDNSYAFVSKKTEDHNVYCFFCHINF